MHYGLKKDGPHAPNGMSQLDSPCPPQWRQMSYQTKCDVTKTTVCWEGCNLKWEEDCSVIENQ